MVDLPRPKTTNGFSDVSTSSMMVNNIPTRISTRKGLPHTHRNLSYVNIRELKQATFLSTRTPTGSKSRRYRWRMVVSAVLVLNQQRQSISFQVRDFKRERLTPSFAIYNDTIYFRLASVTKTSLA